MVSSPLSLPPPPRAELGSDAGHSTSNAPSRVARFEREAAFARRERKREISHRPQQGLRAQGEAWYGFIR